MDVVVKLVIMQIMMFVWLKIQLAIAHNGWLLQKDKSMVSPLHGVILIVMHLMHIQLD